MNRAFGYIILCLCMATVSYCQEAQPAAENSSGGVKISFAVTLERGLDSKKLKEGDAVTCVTSGALRGRNGFLIPSGSKVIGHITQAQARAKGDADSTLGMTFDKFVVSGKDLAMRGTLQAIAPSLNSSGPTTGPAEPGSLSGAGRNDSGRSAGTTPGASSSVKLSGPTTGTPLVNTTSTGVLGIKGVQLDANGLITSAGKQVKLESGTQMMIRAEIQMPVQ